MIATCPGVIRFRAVIVSRDKRSPGFKPLEQKTIDRRFVTRGFGELGPPLKASPAGRIGSGLDRQAGDPRRGAVSSAEAEGLNSFAREWLRNQGLVDFDPEELSGSRERGEFPHGGAAVRNDLVETDFP